MAENIYETPESNVVMDNAGTTSLTLKEIMFSFNGRVGRKVYWLTTLGIIVFVVLLVGILTVMPLPESVIGMLTIAIYIPVLWISLAVQAKRWHDRDKSGWWILIGLVPVIGGLWALIENGFLAGTYGENRFGMPNV